MRGSNRKKGWLAFVLVLATASALFVAADHLSPQLPGSAGVVFRQNVAADIEATALIYTESGDVMDYLDSSKGKYTRAAIENGR